LDIFLAIRRQFGFFLVSLFGTMLMMAVMFAGLIVLNAYIIVSSVRCYSGTSCTSNEFASYNVAMLCLGLVAFLLCLIYFGAFPMCVQKYVVAGVNRTGVMADAPVLVASQPVAYTPGVLRSL
jgi:hypothetical protein